MRRHAFATFDSLVCIWTLSAIALACALSPIQNDTWWHLRAGADMVHTGHVLLTDTYSHTVLGAGWPNHEWLSEVFFYAAYAAGGLPLVMLSATALIVIGWAIVWRLCEGPALYRLLIVGPFLLPASMHWEPRPHAFSLLLIPLTLQLMVADRIWWLPAIFVVWANCHGGVVMGLVIVGAACTAASLDRPSRWRRYAIVFLLCTVATTVTPLGISFWQDIPASLARIRRYPIDEWLPPRFGDIRMAPFWVGAVVLLGGTIRSWRTLCAPESRRARITCCTALAALPLAAGAIRNIGPFMMLAAPALTALWQRRAAEDPERSRREYPAFNAVASAAAVAAVAVAVGGAYWLHLPRLRWSPLPEASLQALERCPDNLYNRYDDGGYLIWFAPDRRVFLDSRQDPYPPALVEDQLRIEQSGDFAPLFARYSIHCAFVPTASPVASRLSAAGWRSLYRDPTWAVLAALDAPGKRQSF